MSRIVHIAIKVNDIEVSKRFYAEVFGFTHTKTERNRDHISCHMSDGYMDLALVLYDNEDSVEAQLSGPGPRLHHWGVTVDSQAAAAERIQAHGGTIISPPGSGALKFRAPDGTLAEVVREGRYLTD